LDDLSFWSKRPDILPHFRKGVLIISPRVVMAKSLGEASSTLSKTDKTSANLDLDNLNVA